MNIEQIYSHFPIYLQNRILTIEAQKIYDRRYSSSFFELLNKYSARTFFSYDKIVDYRNKRLSNFLNFCSGIKYYSKYALRNSHDNAEESLDKLPIFSNDKTALPFLLQVK